MDIEQIQQADEWSTAIMARQAILHYPFTEGTLTEIMIDCALETASNIASEVMAVADTLTDAIFADRPVSAEDWAWADEVDARARVFWFLIPEFDQMI